MADPHNPGKRPTQADVARLARVSQAAVSQILNDAGTISVSPETRRRILAAAEQLGYVPDQTARSLRVRKAYAIAGIVPDITNPFYPVFSRGVQDVAEQHGYDFMLYNTDGTPEKEQKSLYALQRGRIDGVIGVFFHLTARELRQLLERGISVVRLESRAKKVGPLPLDNLYVDNSAAVCAAVSYLIRKGHQRIAMITGRLGPREMRVLGYQQALREHEKGLEEHLIEVYDFTEKGGYSAMRTLLQQPRRVSAVFAANDLLAIGAMSAIREAGLHIPQDVALVGFDDIPAAALVSPSLTTVTQLPDKLGRRATEMLFERLEGAAPPGGRCEALPFELIIRESA